MSSINPFSLVGSYGTFQTEEGGRLSGTVINVGRPRRDGKYPVSYRFGSGNFLNKLMTLEAVQVAIASVTQR